MHTIGYEYETFSFSANSHKNSEWGGLINLMISKLIQHETGFFSFMKLKAKPSKEFSGNIFS